MESGIDDTTKIFDGPTDNPTRGIEKRVEGDEKKKNEREADLSGGQVGGHAGRSSVPGLDPRIKQWYDSLLAEAGRKEQEKRALQEQVKQLQEMVQPLKEKLSAFEKAEKERSQAELTELQKIQARLAEVEQERQKLQISHENALSEAKKYQEQLERERQIWLGEREIIAGLAMRNVFPNEFEQEGLFSRIRNLRYESEEDRAAKISAILDSFVATRSSGGGNSNNQTSSTELSSSQHISTASQPSSTTSSVVTPPGGSPTRAPQILEDNYTDEQLLQLARTNRELYEKIADQRAAMRRATGSLPVRYR